MRSSGVIKRRAGRALVIAGAVMLAGCAASPRLLPICNLRCSPDGTCGPAQGVTPVEVGQMVDRILQTQLHEASVITVTSGYALVMNDDRSDKKLRDSWVAAACFTPLSPSDADRAARFQQCLEGMPRWVQYAKPSEANALVMDASFRQVCLGSRDKKKE